MYSQQVIGSCKPNTTKMEPRASSPVSKTNILRSIFPEVSIAVSYILKKKKKKQSNYEN